MAPNAGGFDQGWSANDPCFFKDEARGWILGRVTKVVGVGRTATLSLASTDGKVTAERDASAVEAASERAREGVEDMVALDELTEATVLSTLRVRYDRKQIYTNVGGILVAVTPYETIANVYGEDRMAGACVESTRHRADLLRGRRRVDGVGRPKFDFHTGRRSGRRRGI